MPQKTYILFAILLISNFFINAQKVVTNTTSKPKLVIGLVVDQMRYDYLYKYNNQYGENGFKRLLREGNSCENTYIDYIPTVTGCGHTGIYTGSVPAIHGIASNGWHNYKTGKSMYCAQDDSVKTVGVDGKSGKMSPKNLWVSTVADELRMATNNRSTTIGIALKDRGSILPAGHTANAAYWMDDSLGFWITSSYYMQELPVWVRNYNQQNKARKYLNYNWNLSKPIGAYINSTADENNYEGKYKTEKTVSFPHKTSAFAKAAEIKRTTFGNDITIDFSMEAIKNYKLGRNAVTDFLAVSLSSTDYVGHQFGINAVETEDMYLKLDKIIADFLLFLDKEVGKGNYTLFLTADHGAVNNPTYLQDQKVPAGFLNAAALQKSINEKGKTVFGKNPILDMNDNMIWLNDSLDEAQTITFVKTALQSVEEIQYIIDAKNVNTQTLPDNIKALVNNGYNAQRSGQLYYILKPAFIESYNNATTGTTHGTWNPYDTHIPLVWFGNGITKGKTLRTVHMTDIAPTLANLLQIQAPSGNVGESIMEVLK
jgi:predicted AlkP superfamily pyrophosphatase or phosphodiesterase